MWTLAVVLSYLFIILGSVGMMVYVTKFPFSTSPDDASVDSTTFLGMKGNAVWVWSWRSIIAGTAIQLVDYVAASV